MILGELEEILGREIRKIQMEGESLHTYTSSPHSPSNFSWKTRTQVMRQYWILCVDNFPCAKCFTYWRLWHTCAHTHRRSLQFLLSIDKFKAQASLQLDTHNQIPTSIRASPHSRLAGLLKLRCRFFTTTISEEPLLISCVVSCQGYSSVSSPLK